MEFWILCVQVSRSFSVVVVNLFGTVFGVSTANEPEKTVKIIFILFVLKQTKTEKGTSKTNEAKAKTGASDYRKQKQTKANNESEQPTRKTNKKTKSESKLETLYVQSVLETLVSAVSLINSTNLYCSNISERTSYKGKKEETKHFQMNTFNCFCFLSPKTFFCSLVHRKTSLNKNTWYVCVFFPSS